MKFTSPTTQMYHFTDFRDEHSKNEGECGTMYIVRLDTSSKSVVLTTVCSICVLNWMDVNKTIYFGLFLEF